MPCPFCNRDLFNQQIVGETKRFILFHSKYPVSCGHLLIIPKNHYENVFGMKKTHWNEFGDILFKAREWLDKRYGVKAFNIGWNVGVDAGQTIMHAHCHIIPRYKGDVDNPTGGIRNVIPEEADYRAEMRKEDERVINNER